MAYSAFLTGVVTLTAAQVTSLVASPALLVAGRPGQIINLLACFILYQPGTTPFGTIQTTDCISPVLGSTATALLAQAGLGVIAKGFVDQTVAQVCTMYSYWTKAKSGDAYPSPSSLVGASMYLTQCKQNNYPTGTDWTTGNGTLTVYFRYGFIEA
jgi:hypothetical protein